MRRFLSGCLLLLTPALFAIEFKKYGKKNNDLEFAGIQVAVALSPQVKQRLLATKHKVFMNAYLSDGGNLKESLLGKQTLIPFPVEVGGMITLPTFVIKEGKNKKLNPHLMVQVYSRDDAGKDLNKLNCSTYLGGLPKSGQPVEINCRIP